MARKSTKSTETDLIGQPIVKARTPRAKKADPVEPAAIIVKPRAVRAKKAPVDIPAEEQLVVEFRPATKTIALTPKIATTEKPARRRLGASKPEPTPVPAADGDLVILEWRNKSYSNAPAAPTKDSRSETGSRRNRRKKRADGSIQEPVTAADAMVPREKIQPESRPRREPKQAPKPIEIAPEPAPPQRPVRESISIPADAPQIVMRDGVPILVRNHRVIPPLFFFGASLDPERAKTVLGEIKLASEQGIHTFIHYLELPVDPDKVNDAVQFAGYLLKTTLEIDPEAQIMFRLVFNAVDGWDSKFPNAKFRTASGALSEPSLCDDEFWGVAAVALTSFVKKLQKIDEQKAVLGLHLERGEWFFADGWGYDNSPAAIEKFREWLRLRYRNEIVAFRASWFDGRVTFNDAAIPSYETSRNGDFVRTGRKARRWVDYHLFLSDTAVDRISELAHVVKKASDGYYLVGVSYGYTFEWSHAGNGHLSLGKLLRTPEVDIIAGPPSYKNREAGASCPFPCPIDSFALNGKLYISEEDFKTPISGKQEPDDFNPVIRTPQALENVQWRGTGAALAHQSGVCWMDLWGNGWLQSHGIWARGGQAGDAILRRNSVPAADPEVAVFIDERSLAYLADPKAFALLVQNVREAMLRSGLSAGFYLLSDLAHRERFPDCKLYVFLNAWDMRPEVRSAIKTKLQRDGKTLFWLYAAGLYDGGRDSLERVREVMGIALKPQPFASKSGTTVLNRRHALCEGLPEKALAAGSELEPSYFAIPEDAVVLGEYTQTGLPSYVLREFRKEDSGDIQWRSVFLGEPVVTPALFRALGQVAGCHVWNYHDDVVHVRPPFLTIHCTNAGARSLALPSKWAAYNVTAKDWAASDTPHLKFNALDGSSHVFYTGLKAELEALLARKPEDMLYMEALPPQRDNTSHANDLIFDVPIMKLDEWVEEAWTEDMADDLLLKPSALDIDTPDDLAELDKKPNTTGRRRRRRRRGGGRDSDNGTPLVSEEVTMNVVFRRRE